MRTLAVVAVLMLGCSPKPCAETCAGCCDGFDECHSGTSADAHCGVTGGKFCTICTGGLTCSPTGFCASRGGTGGGGGGGATGGGSGGGGEATVFVTLRFDYPEPHLDGACQIHTVASCTVTKSVAVSRFQELRTTSLAACNVSQVASDGYDANCTGKCTLSRPGCLQNNGVPRSGGDVFYTCTSITGTISPQSSLPCDWTP